MILYIVSLDYIFRHFLAEDRALAFDDDRRSKNSLAQAEARKLFRLPRKHSRQYSRLAPARLFKLFPEKAGEEGEEKRDKASDPAKSFAKNTH